MSDAQPPINLSVQDAQAVLTQDPDRLLLDVRTPAEFAICQLQGATLLPMQEITQRIDELEPFKGKPMIVYCHHGGRSMQVTQYLRNHGFELAQNMAGGIDQWSREIDPTLARY